MEKISIKSTEKKALISITDKINENLSGEGTATIFTPHTTAAILINEDEQNLKQDFINLSEDLLGNNSFNHDKVDNNAKAHLMASIIGHSKTIPFNDSKLALGTWQDVFLFELDGPRNRDVYINIIKN